MGRSPWFAEDVLPSVVCASDDADTDDAADEDDEDWDDDEDWEDDEDDEDEWA